MVIAIDGPAGSGKTSTARALASRLGYRYVDTGAMYRAVALACVRSGLSGDVAPPTSFLHSVSVTVSFQNGHMHILLNGEDVSDEIRTTQVTRASSRFSQFSGVRRLLTDIQRKTVGLVARESGGAVVEGRDMGTVVFPDADIKFYMKADSAERARRRHKELIEAGVSVSLEQVEADIVERDTRDASRAVAPLRPASDAHIIDTTALTPQAQLDEMLTLVQAAGGRR